MEVQPAMCWPPQMAAAAAGAGAGADPTICEFLAAELGAIGDELSLGARNGLAPEVQEIASSWDLRSRALLDAAGAEGGLDGAEAAAAAELLQPMLSGAFAAAYPDLFSLTMHALLSTCLSCSTEALPLLLGPVGASLLDVFANARLSRQLRSAAAESLLSMLGVQGCAEALLAARGADGAVEALIAAAKREEEPHRGDAFHVLATLAGRNGAAAERAVAALLPIARERIQRAAAAGAASRAAATALVEPVRFLQHVMLPSAPAALRARVLATPGLIGAVVDLLVALGSEEWAAAREEDGDTREQPEPFTVLALVGFMSTPATYAAVLEELTSRGALPRVLALLRSPYRNARSAASFCIATIAEEAAGRDALFRSPRAAAELAAALRRAHADGEDHTMTQEHAAVALARLTQHSEGRRVAGALALAAAAEGSAGSLLGALAALIAASVDSGDSFEGRRHTCLHTALLLGRMVSVATAEQLRVLRRAAPLADACVRALQYWLTHAKMEDMAVYHLMPTAAAMAGFEDDQESRPGTQPPAATEDTAAARAALRRAPGLERVLRRYLDWARRQPSSNQVWLAFIKPAVSAARWLATLPEVKAAAAAARPAAVAAAAAAAGPAAAAGERAVAQQPQPQPGAGSSSGGADGSSGSHSGANGASGASGSGAEAAARPRACGECGKSAADEPLLRCSGCKAQYYCGEACAMANWKLHRAACKAARRAAATQRS
ncbi:hypothetical protein Rsub_07303 [Raphidocelis subcapitata]|uniref:MYND-type domain-containing protein n=1 Tax=Raphidocelis subcapitata TaxID=307507 RepID=A0A2V0PAA0_9CHLO|nr:hypothetical protein Rsub_07303 [Raphidocelis subcapitata]|eukprot:GBF94035.1 hypothetical protein Rsub_07303 [Raphidocelis subcapitata]